MQGNPDSGIREILLVESGIGENFAFEFRFWNPEYSSRNSQSQSRNHVLLTNTGIRYLESGIHSVESRIQDCPGFPYMGRYWS